MRLFEVQTEATNGEFFFDKIYAPKYLNLKELKHYIKECVLSRFEASLKFYDYESEVIKLKRDFKIKEIDYDFYSCNCGQKYKKNGISLKLRLNLNSYK